MESVTEQVTTTDLGYEIPTWDNWSPLAKFYHPLQAGSIDGTDTVPHDKAVIRAMLSKYTALGEHNIVYGPKTCYNCV